MEFEFVICLVLSPALFLITRLKQLMHLFSLFRQIPTLARRCRDGLLQVGLSTKILPEAYTWHFAGCWDHMSELVMSHGGSLSDQFASSHAILSRFLYNWSQITP